jgi:hypothetical protein
MNRRLPIVLVAVVLAGGAAWLGLHLRAVPPAGQSVAGGDGGGLPRATPVEEGLEQAGLDAARAQAHALGARAFLVLRHGHLVLEDASGLSADELVPGGDMGKAVQGLLAGIALREFGLAAPQGGLAPAQLVAGIEREGKLPYARYLSRSIWQPLNAGGASLSGDAAAVAQGCCLAARAVDWLRVGALLLDDGRFEGTEVAPPGWARAMLQPMPDDATRGFGVWLAAAATGAEPFAAPGVAFLRGPGRTRLWLMPTLDLAVLLVDDPKRAADARDDESRFDETRVPNLVIRSLRDQQRAQASGLDALVPGH